MEDYEQLTEKSRGRMEQGGRLRAAAADREEQRQDGTGLKITSSAADREEQRQDGTGWKITSSCS